MPSRRRNRALMKRPRSWAPRSAAPQTNDHALYNDVMSAVNEVMKTSLRRMNMNRLHAGFWVRASPSRMGQFFFEDESTACQFAYIYIYIYIYRYIDAQLRS
jgi:hypothetical protein